MQHWIFQAIPERYDLREHLNEGGSETWYATRYISKMQPGDIVWFWLGGVPREERGIYAWGHLAGEAYIKKGWDSHGVDVYIDHVLPRPIVVDEFVSNKVLSKMLILRMAIGTNFVLTDAEAAELMKYCKKVLPPDTPLPTKPGE